MAYVTDTDLASTAAGKGAAMVGWRQFGTGAEDRTVDDRLKDAINATDFMTSAMIASARARNLAVDCTGGLLAAIEYARTSGQRAVYIPAGRYLTTAPIGPSAEAFGIELIGAGVFATELHADHDDGAVVFLNRSSSRISDMTLSASTGRKTGAAGRNYGLLIEPPDQADKACTHISVERVRVIDQPSHGIVQIGLAIMSKWTQAMAQNNLGHGFVLDSGVMHSRTYTGYPGLHTLDTCWAAGNAGHGLKVGDPADASNDLPVRVLVLNGEFAENALTSGVRLSEDELWIRGANHELHCCAVGTGTSPGTIGGIRFAGENLHISNLRTVGGAHTLRLEADHVLARTWHINVDGLRCLNYAENPVVRVEDLDAVSDVHVKTYGMNANVTRMFTPGAVRSTWDLAAPVQVVRKKSDQTLNNAATLADDSELQSCLFPSEVVAFEANLRHKGDSSADIKVAFVAPAGATIRWDNLGGTYVAPSDAIAVSNSELAEGLSRSFGAVTGTRTISIRGVVVMGSTAGPLKLQWAQNTAVNVDTSVLASSYLKVLRANNNV